MDECKTCRVFDVNPNKDLIEFNKQNCFGLVFIERYDWDNCKFKQIYDRGYNEGGGNDEG